MGVTSGWTAELANVLPKLKSKLQLSGFALLVAAVVATQAVAPDNTFAQLSAGAVGILFIVFGQVFSSLKDFPEQERTRLVLTLFVLFCIFVLTLGILTAYALKRPPPNDDVVLSGIVEDEAGNPVQGAAVTVDGIPEIGFTTSDNGNFFIPITRTHRRAKHSVRALKDLFGGTKVVEEKSFGESITVRILRMPIAPSAAKAISIDPRTTPLPSGNVTLYDGFRFGDQSTFAFASAKILPWGSPSDIGVAAPGSESAMFFLMHDLPPYTDPHAKGHAVENAGIIEMETSDLTQVLEAPESGYKVHYFQPIVGRVYCVRTRDGHHFSKIKITFVGPDRITFDYVFQPSGSRSLAP